MHPTLAEVLERLRRAREESGLTPENLGEQLLLAPGWIGLYESGLAEPPLSVVLAMSKILGVSIDDLIDGLDFEEPAALIARPLRAEQDGDDLLLFFLFGVHEVNYRIRGGKLDQFDDMLRLLIRALLDGDKSGGVARAFLHAVAVWPEINPSDLWYFVIPRAFMDPYNHPAAAMGTDFAQSWKRTSGWALERVFMDHYNRALEDHHVLMVSPSKALKERHLREMGLGEHGIADKADILLMTNPPPGEGPARCFGVVHVKASFAERRTDDVPLSQALIARGFVSPLVTMDCKGVPGPEPENNGELGASWDGVGADPRGQKRIDIERDGKFDACFSFNARTEPTAPKLREAAARVHVCSFGASPHDDPFVRHVLAGLEPHRSRASRSPSGER